jgi:hypothetical protein
MQGAAMSTDADHEVIDSTEALFRHLYEEHGVEEARDLDPETAPVQFWLRRHAELERAQRSARRQPNPPPEPEPWPEPGGRAQPPPRSGPPPGARDGRRHAGFGDPLLEAMTRALVGRGHEEAVVRTAIRSFPAAGGQPAGEAGVRAAFVEPMLRAVAEHLLGAGGARRPPARPQPAAAPSAPARPQPAPAPSAPARPQPAAAPARAAATPPPRPSAAPARPAAREEPARPEAVWAGLWADLADTGRRPGEDGARTSSDDGDDLMAVANAVQARRRTRRRRR